MSDKTPLIFLPGLLCDAALWQGACEALVDVADSQVADLTRQDSISALAESVLANASPRFALAGLSMGGYVAFEIMRQAPERVLKLALFNTNARADAPEVKERRRLLLALSRTGAFKGVTPRLLPSLLAPEHLENKAITDTILTMAERVGREAFQNQQTAIMKRKDSREDLEKIACPTLVVGGKQDPGNPPERLEEIAAGIRGARLELIDHCGHLAPLEQPEATHRLLREWIAG